MSNGINKNLDVVKQEFADWRLDMAITTHKVKGALSRKDYVRAAHYASGYLGGTIEELSRFWFYTWAPKWGIVIAIMIVLAGCDALANSR